MNKKKYLESKYFEDGLSGTYDVEIDKIYDIKSASDWAFKNKFSMGFDAVEKDVFDISHKDIYMQIQRIKVCGWIVVNKSTGEMCLYLHQWMILNIRKKH